MPGRRCRFAALSEARGAAAPTEMTDDVVDGGVDTVVDQFVRYPANSKSSMQLQKTLYTFWMQQASIVAAAEC